MCRFFVCFFLKSTDQHDINELLFASEYISLFLHALTDGFSYKSNALDQTEFHGQVLKWDKNNTNRCAMIQKKRPYTDQKI